MRHVYPRTTVSVSQHYTNQTQRDGLEQSGAHHHIIDIWYCWKITELALSNNHSLTHSLTHSLNLKNIYILSNGYHRDWCMNLSDATLPFIRWAKKSLKIPNGLSETANRRTDTTMAYIKRMKGQQAISKTLQRLNYRNYIGWNQVLQKSRQWFIDPTIPFY